MCIYYSITYDIHGDHGQVMSSFTKKRALNILFITLYINIKLIISSAYKFHRIGFKILGSLMKKSAQMSTWLMLVLYIVKFRIRENQFRVFAVQVDLYMCYKY